MPVKYRLYLFVDNPEEELNRVYESKINLHNEMILNNEHADSGFDLFVPVQTHIITHWINKIDFQVKCCMKRVDDTGAEHPSAFYMYPRSSITKSHVRLANNVGIIDSGYRGNLIGVFDAIYTTREVDIETYTRLCQICTPTLEPFEIIKVESADHLGNTVRGDGGFGSTGLVK